MRKVIKILLKLLAWLIIIIFALPIVVVLLLNVGVVQNLAVDAATSFLSRKLETVVTIDRLRFRGFSNLNVDGIFIQDYTPDTMLFVQHLSLDLDRNAIFSKKIVLDDVALDSAKIYLRLSEEGMNLSQILAHFASDPDKEPSAPISIRLNNVSIENSRFMLQNQGAVSVPGQVDFANLIFSDLNIASHRIDILGGSIGMDISAMSFKDRSGLAVSNLSVQHLAIDDGLVSLEGARLQTPDSDIDIPLFSMTAESWEQFSDFVDSVTMRLDVEQSLVSARTAAYFVSAMAGNDLALDNLSIHFDGPVNDFSVDVASGVRGGNLTLRANAAMAGATDFNNARFDLDIVQLDTDGSTVNSIIGMFSELSGNVEDMLVRAGDVALTGTATGKISAFNTDIDMVSNIGNVRVDAAGGILSDGKMTFDGRVRLTELDAGRLLANQTFGDITAELRAKGATGNGTLNLDAVLELFRAGYNGYIYEDINISGSYNDGDIVAEAVSEDPKLTFDLQGNARLDEIPYVDADVHLTSIDLHALGVGPDTLRSVLSTNIRAVGSGSDPDNINADIWITDLRYETSKNTVQLDSIWLTGRNSDLSKYLALHSPIVEIDYSSSVGYRQIYDYLKHILFDYLPTLDSTPEVYAHRYEASYGNIATVKGVSVGNKVQSGPVGVRPQGMSGRGMMPRLAQRNEIHIPSELHVFVKDASPLTDIFIPGLSVADATRLDIVFDPRTEDFNLTLGSNYIEYNDFLLTRLAVGVDNTSVENSIMLNISTEDSYVSKFLLQENHISARVTDDTVTLNALFGTAPSEPNARLTLKADLMREDDKLHVGLVVDPESYVSFGRRWNLSSQRIDYSDKLIRINDFAIADSDGKILTVDGVVSPSASDTLRLVINDFRLEPFSALIGIPDGSLEGRVSGQADLISALNNPVMFADIGLNELALNGYHAAPLRLSSSWDFSNERARLALSNLNTQRDIVRGFYRPDAKFYSVTVDVDGIPLAAADPFLPQSVISSLGGDAAAFLELRSREGNLSIGGTLSVTDFQTTVAMTNVTYRTDVLDIDVDDGFVNIPLTVLHDDENHQVTLRADADISNFSNVNYRAHLVLDDVLVINTGPGDNDLFYGKVFLSGAVNIRGDRSGVNVDVAVETQSDSEFYLPLSSKSEITEADWISFKKLTPQNIDSEDIVEYKKLSHQASLNMAALPSEKMDVNLNVSLDVSPGLLVSIIVDPATNMVLNARGSASLDVMLNPGTGDLAVFGTYEIADGDFLFSLPPLISNRKFVLQPGGTIQLSGDPLDAVLNIEAVYRVRASLQQLAADLEGTGLNTSSRIPVDCVIKISENLANPDITFDIQVPSADADIQSVLSGALVTNEDRALNFLWLVGFSSFAPSGSVATEDTAGSASAALGLDFLTNQLSNILSTDDLSIMVRYRPQDQTSSEEVDFGFSYNIGGNNRLILEVEGNYNADNSLRQNSNSNISGDASLTWILTPDGNLLLKGFTRTINRYDENQGLQENGVGIYYKEDFDVFSDIGRRRRQQRRQKPSSAKPNGNVNDMSAGNTEYDVEVEDVVGPDSGDDIGAVTGNIEDTVGSKSETVSGDENQNQIPRKSRIEERREESERRRTRAIEARRQEREAQERDAESQQHASENHE